MAGLLSLDDGSKFSRLSIVALSGERCFLLLLAFLANIGGGSTGGAGGRVPLDFDMFVASDQQSHGSSLAVT